jgi:Ca-activated chloride channel family protein
MKHLKTSVMLTLLLLLLIGIHFPVASAQQGPQSQSSETVAKPKTKDIPPPADTDQTPIPSQYKKDKETPSNLPTFRSDVTAVQVEVAVLDNKGNFIPNIPKDKFRVLEDNVPQQIATFTSNADAPMTIAMVIEFDNLFQRYYSRGWYETLSASYGFVQMLKPEDYVAIVAFDMRPEILCDFTLDRMKVQEGLQRMRIPGFSESNMFDAVVDTVQRMDSIEGRKAILLIATGRDTFSKLTFDKARKAIQEGGVPIYTISILQALRIMADSQMGPLQRMDFLQADNEMNTFARESGGKAFFPRFMGEYPGIFQSVIQALKNQYSIAYHPSNQAKDGKYRKIKVELVNPENGEQLKIVDEKHKPIKYSVIAKGGYTAPREVE